MNNGEVLVDGSVADARDLPRVQEVYIGSGTHALAERAGESAARDTLLKVDKANTFYGKSHILRDVSFDVRGNEIVALLGRNGAGKSTLLKTLVGITPPATGSIALDGEDLAGRPSAQIARAWRGLRAAGPRALRGMSVAHNLSSAGLKRRTGRGVHWEEDRIFEFFPRLKERCARPADYLSGGEQQMLAVARALNGDTRLLLLDEPFEGLAPAVVEELFVAFDKLRQEVSIVIVDHHLDLALALSGPHRGARARRRHAQGPSHALASGHGG
jgi:ABC-type branched-subunit amino acid transport system ATPase component